MDRLRFSTVNRPRRRRRLPLMDSFGQRGLLNVLAGAVGLGLLLYLRTERWWLLAVVLVVAVAGLDQVLRAHPRAAFAGAGATAIYLFVPGLFILGGGLFLRQVTEGLWTVPAAVLGGAIYGLAAHAEYLTVEAAPSTYPAARLALSLVSYLTAFAVFVVVFTSGLPLPAAALIVTVAAMLLTVDILRELEVRTGLLFAYAAGVAAVVAEARWAMYYLALPDLLAGALLLVAFYLLTGLTQSYLSGHLDRRSIAEFGAFGAMGVVIITAAGILTRSG